MTDTVAIVIDSDFIGGAERFVVDLINGADATRWQFVVIGNRNRQLESWIGQQTAGKVEYRAADMRSAQRSIVAARARLARLHRRGRSIVRADPPAAAVHDFDMFSPHRLPGDRVLLVVKLWHGVVNAVVLRRELRRISPEVVHVNNGGYPGAAAVRVAPIAARLAGCRRVVTVVHQYAVEPRLRRRTERLIDRVIDRCTSHWYTAAQASSRRLGEVRAIAADKISTIYLGQQRADAEPSMLAAELGVPDGRFVIAQIGILWRRKGQAVAVTALELLTRRHLDVHLVLIGDGEDRHSLEQLAHRLGVLDRVTFTGFRTDVRQLLGAADLLINPSVEFELLPYAIKEAMAAALPVVATDVGATCELVDDGETGVLIAANDATALADTIAELIYSPETRASMGEAGRARIEHFFSMQTMLDAVSVAYDNA